MIWCAFFKPGASDLLALLTPRGLGRRHEAIHIAEELQATSRKRYVSPYGLAQIYAVLQSDGETFKWLQAAHQDRAVWMGTWLWIQFFIDFAQISVFKSSSDKWAYHPTPLFVQSATSKTRESPWLTLRSQLPAQ